MAGKYGTWGPVLRRGGLVGWLVYWGLTPQQQPGSYRGGDYDDEEMLFSLVEETGVPGWNHRPTASNCQTFTHKVCAGLCPAPGSNPSGSGVKPGRGGGGGNNPVFFSSPAQLRSLERYHKVNILNSNGIGNVVNELSAFLHIVLPVHSVFQRAKSPKLMESLTNSVCFNSVYMNAIETQLQDIRLVSWTMLLNDL